MTMPTLDDPAFAELVLLVLAAPLIIGAAWRWMRYRARADAVRRFERWR